MDLEEDLFFDLLLSGVVWLMSGSFDRVKEFQMLNSFPLSRATKKGH